MNNRHIAKSAFYMSMVTFTSRLFGLAREWLRGYLLGTTSGSDAFTIAFMFPNLLRRLVGEGALTAAFIPVFSDYLSKGNKDELDEFVKSFFTVLLLFLIVLVAIVLLFAPLLRYVLPEFTKIPGKIELTIILTRIMFPYILFISLAALSQAILNSFKVFVPSATTPILLNISIITLGFALARKFYNPSLALAVGVIFGGILQFSFQLPFLNKYGIKYGFVFNIKNPGVKRVIMLMLPGAIGAGVYQINALVSQIIAAFLEEGSVAALRFSNTLVELVLGVFVISISTVILPALSEKSSQGDREGMKENLSFALKLVFLVTLPSMVGLIILRKPIVSMLFRYGKFTQASVEMVSYALIFHSLGISGTGASRIVVQMFYSMKDTKTPVYVATVAMAINLVLCYFLSFPLKLGGIALAGSVSSYSNYLLLWLLLRKRMGRIADRSVLSSFLKSFLSSILMGVVVFIGYRFLRNFMDISRYYNAIATLLLLAVAVISYVSFNLVLKNQEIIELMKIIKARFKNKKG